MNINRGNRHPLSQFEVEQMIAADIELLEEITDDYGDVLVEEAETDAAYKKRWARVFKTVSGTMALKEAQADDECSDEYRAKLVAAAKAKAMKEHLWTIRNRIEALRSLNTNVRAQS